MVAQCSGCPTSSRGRRVDLAGGEQLAEGDVAAEDVAAGAGHQDHVVGGGEAERLPHLVGDGLRALEEEGVPVVAGVGDLRGLADRLVRDLVAGAADQLDLGAVRAGLEDLGRRGRGRDDDLRAGCRRRRRRRRPRNRRCPNCPRARGRHLAPRRWDIITDTPRSLKLEVGLNHSSLKWTRRPSQSIGTIGVQPSPRLTRCRRSTGMAAW